MKYLDLFSGCGTGSKAIHNVFPNAVCLGFSEIDKYAIKIYKKHFPNHPYLGGIEGIDFTQFKGIVKLIIGGSPCTDLSISKKDRKSLDGAKSKLFFEYIRAIKECQPQFFILENVKSMSDEARDIISGLMGCEPIMIDSATVSAQQRKRYYWCNFPVSQPVAKSIYLKDILELEVDEKYFLGIKAMDYMGRATKDGRTHWDFFHNHDSREEKSKCLVTNLYKGIPYNVLIDARPISVYGKSSYTFTQLQEAKPEKGINFIGAVNFDSRFRFEDGKNHLSRNIPQGNRVHSAFGKSCTLNAQAGGLGGKTGLYLDPFKLQQNLVLIRKLTPIECERLQCLPDDYTKGVSNTQRYRMLGNGFTLNVIEHILNELKKFMITLTNGDSLCLTTN